jgi:hypothetical protein
VDEAFVLLRSHARRSGAHLGDVAHAVLTDPATLAGLSERPASERERTAPASHEARATTAAPKRKEGPGHRERLRDILGRADERDRAAERRDRAAEKRPSEDAEAQSGIDRLWAGHDRDQSMIDRADLINELRDRDTPEGADEQE